MRIKGGWCVGRSLRLLISACLLTIVASGQVYAGSTGDVADKCFKRAEHYEKEAVRRVRGDRESRKWFDLAMKNYLCAANKGHVMAKWRAAVLSGRSGDAVEALPEDMFDRFLREAAEAGIHEAQIWLYEIHCDNISAPHVCKKPVESEKWLLTAARTGSARATFYLGVFYERGEGGEGTTRIDKALACYRLAAQRYESAMKGKNGEALHQLKSELELVSWGTERVLRQPEVHETHVSCY